MKFACFITFVLLCSSVAQAANLEIQRGTTTTLSVKLSYLRESMIVLPEAAQSVSGVSKPAFQVEPGRDHILIRPLQEGAQGNLFIDLGRRTLVVLSLKTASSDGEDVVGLQYAPSMRLGEQAPQLQNTSALASDLQFLAAPWKVEKLKLTGKYAGVIASIRYVARMGDMVLVHFSLKNKSDTPFSLTRIALQRCTLGGITGAAVLEQNEIPTQTFFAASELGQGDEISGSLLFPFFYLDHDQVIAFRALNQREQGPEVRLSL